MHFFGQKSAIMDFFFKIFSQIVKFYNRPDKMKPKSSQYHLPMQSYGQKSLQFLKNPKIGLSESEKGPPFWNRTKIWNKNPLLFFLTMVCIFGENLSPIQPASLEKPALLRKIFQKVIQLVGMMNQQLKSGKISVFCLLLVLQ